MKEKAYEELFAEFPAISTEAWEAKIRDDLKGAATLEKLTWKSDESIEVKPFYRQENLESLQYLESIGRLKGTGGAPNGWTICQEIFLENNLKDTNKRIQAALKGGAQAFRIHLSDTQALHQEALGSLLDGVPLGDIELIFHGYLGADSLYDHLCELSNSRDVDPADLKGSLGADPLGKMIETGYPIASMENVGKLVRKVKTTSPGMRVIDVNGALFQNAGSTLAEELAFALSMASDYMAVLTEQGLDPNEIRDSLQLSLAAGSNYFMEIAKLRASRILWEKISKAYGIESSQKSIRIHSITSEWNMTLYDPYVNMLRGTTEAMSAILGGADLVSVLPFDHPYGRSTLFSDRIARSAQLILREEAYFDRVSDPASGSYFIEYLTDALGEKTWDLFRESESKGGFRKVFEMEWIQEKVLASRTKKMDRVNSGEARILGTNSYPNFNELILDKLDKRTYDELYDPPLIPLKSFRFSSMFEDVRLETEKSEKRPRVLLFKYGNPVWVSARATFSGNLFACAGYEILESHAFSTVEAGLMKAKEANAEVVVLCSSDDTYSELAPVVLNTLKDQSIIVVAGYPANSIEMLRKSGINHFIHMNSNLLETLREFNKLLL